MNSIKATRRGFTLIELLVFIAILAAILFPVFAKARAKARQASDASNQKQIGLGFLQYVQDYDETYPPIAVRTNLGAPASPAIAAWGPDYTISPNVIVPGLLSPYIKSNQLFQDPSGPRPGAVADSPAGNTINGYMYNDLLAGRPQADASGVASTVLTINGDGQSPRQTYGATGNSIAASPVAGRQQAAAGHSILDASMPIAQVSGTNDPTVEEASSFGARDQITETAANRHSDGANVGYADGHVKWTKIVVEPNTATNRGIYFPSRVNNSPRAAVAPTVPAGGARGVGAANTPPCAIANTEPNPGGDMCGFTGTFHLN